MDAWWTIIQRLDMMDILNFASTCRSGNQYAKDAPSTSSKVRQTNASHISISRGWKLYYDDVRTDKFCLHDVSKWTDCEKNELKSRFWVDGKDDWCGGLPFFKEPLYVFCIIPWIFWWYRHCSQEVSHPYFVQVLFILGKVQLPV